MPRRRSSSCPRGQIRRRAFTRSPYHRRSFVNRRGTRVSSTRVSKSRVPSGCVKDMGKRGKTPRSKRVLPKLSPGRLGKYGYSTKISPQKRREALAKAMDAEGYATIVRRVVAASNYMKRTAPESYANMRDDLKWAQHYHKKRGSTLHSTRRTRRRRGESRRRRSSSMRKRRSSRGGSRRRRRSSRGGSRRRRSHRSSRHRGGSRRRRSSCH